jgi:hypothetical protein
MIQVSSIPGLINSSLLLCVSGLIVTSVLLREQRRLVDTNFITVVSMTSFCMVSILTLTLTGRVPGLPEHQKLRFPADWDRLQPASSFVPLGIATVCLPRL